jgi:hypothetical protein
MMNAISGDWVVEPDRRHNRTGLILGVYGTEGSRCYLVRWEDDGRETLLVPGPATQFLSAQQRSTLGNTQWKSKRARTSPR